MTFNSERQMLGEAPHILNKLECTSTLRHKRKKYITILNHLVLKFRPTVINGQASRVIMTQQCRMTLCNFMQDHRGPQIPIPAAIAAIYRSIKQVWTACEQLLQWIGLAQDPQW